uniref:Uncharacterized protein n=1 Tax=Pipistrellus kuhlii TaxID=59472 RepID=A0A7J7W3L6_PIPKU|nr:hypothetical protein mPipKuh1_008164 [Pipistrellus kuhlii]
MCNSQSGIQIMVGVNAIFCQFEMHFNIFEIRMTSHNHSGQETGGPAAISCPCAVVSETLTIILDVAAVHELSVSVHQTFCLRKEPEFWLQSTCLPLTRIGWTRKSSTKSHLPAIKDLKDLKTTAEPLGETQHHQCSNPGPRG